MSVEKDGFRKGESITNEGQKMQEAEAQ